MSLETLLKENTEATLAQNELLKQLLAGTSAGAITAATTTSSTDTEETTEAPKRERGKPSPGKSKRTAAEVAEDKAADEADAANAGGDTTDTGAVTFDVLKKALATWLGEFAKEEDKDAPEGAHPEVAARKDALKTLLKKLGAEKLPEIAADATKVGKLHNWLVTSGKEGKKDKDSGELVFGAGRWAADPEPEDETTEEDDLDI